MKKSITLSQLQEIVRTAMAMGAINAIDHHLDRNKPLASTKNVSDAIHCATQWFDMLPDE